MSEREPPKLPELPESNWCETTVGAHSMGTLYYFTAEQMRSYGTACFEAGVKAGREAAAAMRKHDLKG